MGMFDWVRVPDITCPYCNKLIPACATWQSKEGDCMLDEIPFTEVGRFYTSCPNCNKWVEFKKRYNYPETTEYLVSNYFVVEDDDHN